MYGGPENHIELDLGVSAEHRTFIQLLYNFSVLDNWGTPLVHDENHHLKDKIARENTRNMPEIHAFQDTLWVVDTELSIQSGFTPDMVASIQKNDW